MQKERINEYITLSTSLLDGVTNAGCVASKDEQHIYLTYQLTDSECLFDFTNSKNCIQLQIAKNYFEKYEEQFDLIVEKQTICCNTQSKLYELINCKLEGFTRKVFLESVVLYLIYQVQKNNLLFQLNCDTCSFINRPLEVEKIQKAQKFILSNLDQNITIPIIAKSVGTNQCYLKKAFKEIVGQTIFEYIQENRMTKAKHLLSHSNKTIADIAFEVGYASSSSFSQTFKNYFGISPKHTN